MPASYSNLPGKLQMAINNTPQDPVLKIFDSNGGQTKFFNNGNMPTEKIWLGSITGIQILIPGLTFCLFSFVLIPLYYSIV